MLAAGLLVGLQVSVLHGAGGWPGEYLHRFDPQRITPHVRWAKPWARGRLKVLLLVQMYVGSRSATELWQRLDCDLKVVTVKDRDHFVAADRYHRAVAGTGLPEKTSELRKALASRYDVIVLGHFALAALSRELQFRLLSQVADGAGLVLTFGMQKEPAFLRRPTVEDRDRILIGVPLARLPYYVETFPQAKTPAALGKQVVRTFRLKQGRIAVLDYGRVPRNTYGANALCPVEPWSFQAQTGYEYHQALVIRAILWASRTRQSDLAWVAVPDHVHVWRQSMPAKAVLTVQHSGPAPRQVTCRVVVRDMVNTVEHKAERRHTVRHGRNELALEIPRLSAGRHFVDCWLTSARGIENWATVPILVRGKTTLQEVTLETASVKPRAAIRGTALVTVGQGGPKPTGLLLTITDTDGRVIEKARVACAGTKTTFEIGVRHALTLAGRLRVALVGGTDILDTRDVEVFFWNRDPGPFVGVTWNINADSHGILMKLAADILREAGFRASLSAQGSTADYARQYNLCGMMQVPYVTRIPTRLEGHQFASKRNRDRVRQSALEHGRNKAPYSILVYSLGDENYMPKDMATGGEDLAAYRQWLARKYGTVARLNAAWGTAYTDFKHVPPATVKDARDRNHFTAYHDFHTYREHLYADLHRYWAHWITQGDPQAKVGAEGSQPGDLEVTLPGLALWSPYQNRYYNALENSLAPRTLLRGNWWAGYISQRRGSHRQWMLWTSLLDGCNSIWCYASDCSAEGIFNLDLRFAKHFEGLVPLVRELTGGVGQLLATSRWPHHGVAIHHSQASVHAGRVQNDLDTVEKAQEAWLGLFQGLGVSVKHLTVSQIEKGELRWPHWRVLVLPYSQAITDKEGAAIKRFVTQGGWVLADTRPGVLRGDCSPRRRGVLDDLLGLSHAQKPSTSPVAKPVTLAGRIAGKPIRLVVQPRLVDGGVRLAGAKPMGQAGSVPLGIRHKVGKGTTFLLNVSLNQLTSIRPASHVRELVRALLAEAAPSIRWKLAKADGTPADGVRLCAFERQGVTLLALLSPSGVEGVRLELAKPATVVYDLRAGKVLGRSVKHLPVDLASGEAVLLALCEQPLLKLQVTAPSATPRGGLVPVKVCAQGPAGPLPDRVFRLDLYDPDGKWMFQHRQVLLGACAEVPIAYSARAGRWRIVVRDMISGVETQHGLTVR